jgi:hypothetical protein
VTVLLLKVKLMVEGIELNEIIIILLISLHITACPIHEKLSTVRSLCQYLP